MKMKPGRGSGVRDVDRVEDTGPVCRARRGEAARGRRGSMENQELYAELKMKADELEKEFQEHKLRGSYDRSDSGRWSKVPVEEDEKRGGGDDGGRGHGLRGVFYDKYMEKRNMRLRTERVSRLATMSEAKLRAMRDDLERWMADLKGTETLPEEGEISDARRRLQKFRSFNMRPTASSEEEDVNIRRLGEDGDLSKLSRQKSTRGEQYKSEASKRRDSLPIPKSYEPRKDFPVRNPSSSAVARGGPPAIPRPLNKSTGYSSARKMGKPENPIDFRKENAKPPPVVGRKANQSVGRNMVQTRITSEVSQKLRLVEKSSVSPLGYKNGSERNPASQKVFHRRTENSNSEKRFAISFESEPLMSMAKPKALVYEPRNGESLRNLSSDLDELADIAKVDVLSMMFDVEEGDQSLLEKFSKSIDLDPFLGNVLEQDPRNIPSLDLHKDQGHDDVKVTMDNTGNDEVDLEDSTIAAKDLLDLRSSQETDESGNFESANGDTSGSQSNITLSIVSVSELPNLGDLKNLEPVIIENPHGLSTGKEPTQPIVNVISYEADAAQQREIESPANSASPASYSHGRSRKGILKGFRRFLILSKRSRGGDISADWLSATTSEGDDEIFSESIILEEQVQSIHFPVTTPSARTRHKVGYASERSLKATRSFFSLSSFRCKGDDSKPR
ncbi:hypothetical protein MLD38_030266 [Melastoma candidum]|uniref:Uncharacterized protein n=1 Tax=Melastoma candidum TaxID=119954 RepID=A0ACB9MMN8_9MYRT|nr:hypothetical protein MLD38_030266 [Melastoma candidum]